MTIFDFKKRFSISIDPEEVRKDFVNKANHFLFQNLDEKIGRYYINSTPGKKFFDFICLSIGKEPRETLIEDFSGDSVMPKIRQLTKNDFDMTMVLIETVYDYFQKFYDYDKDKWIELINVTVTGALEQLVPLNIYWHDGKFYPQGAEVLDEKLIKDQLDWLNTYPKVREFFKNSLDHYATSENDAIKRKDTVHNAFMAVDQMSRIILNNDKAFDNNYNLFVNKIGLNTNWKNILNYYKELSKEFGRHPGVGDEYIPEKADTEAFLYLSGIILRLSIQKIKDI